jgi:hypothetical protein
MGRSKSEEVLYDNEYIILLKFRVHYLIEYKVLLWIPKDVRESDC